MFYYLEGVISVIEPNMAVVDIGGVGYACNTTAYTLSYLEVGKKAKLYTYCNIREDAFDIFAFHDISEKKCFEMLISVSGVGPKAAISILSSTTPDGLMTAIVSGNEKLLTAAPGIGKRIAQRIILELKDKASKEGAVSAGSADTGLEARGVSGGKVSEVTAALTVLGYSAGEISAALRKLDVEALSTEEIIRQVLRGSLK